MKAKNQQILTSEFEAKEKLIVYVYEYLIHSGARQAADIFKNSIGYDKEIKVNDGPGFLHDWWCVFWDLYCAGPEKRSSQGEPSSDARAFHDYMIKSNPSMSPSITQTSPPQHPQQALPPPHQFMGGGPRYGMPPGQARGPPPRMQGPPGQHGPPPGFMPAGSPRYAQHPGPPPLPPSQPHMNQGPMFGPGPDHQMGPSPGLNRMTPVGGPPGPPPHPNGPPGPGPQMVGMPGGQQMGVPGPGQGQPPPPQVMQPPRNGSQGSAAGGWQGNVNYNVNSPANHQMGYNGPGSNQPPPPPQQGGPMMMGDGVMMDVKSSPMNGADMGSGHGDEYVMPGPFGQDGGDQIESAEIMQIKKSIENDANPHSKNMFEKDQSDFNLGDYADPQKW